MRTVLLLVTSDPRKSPRPAEALRVAAGLNAWRNVKPLLYFGGAAAAALAPGDFVDEEIYRQHLDGLAAIPGTVYVEAESQSASLSNVQALTRLELANLATKSDCVLYF